MKKNETKKNNKGFSLVELIVVIAIMAVLVGVLAPQFIQYVERSRISTDIQNMDQIKTAVEVYCTENDDLTGSLFGGVLANTTNHKGTVDANFKEALEAAGLSGTEVKFKSAKWENVNLTVNDGAVSVSGAAIYKKVSYPMDGSESKPVS